MRRLFGLLLVSAVLMCMASLAAIGANGTVSGTITSDEPGTPAIAGALIRTDGEPGFSATSGSNGSYSLSAPAGAYVLLISASGHDPQRSAITVSGGSTVTANAALGLATSGVSVNMPAPLDWGEPAGAPNPPGDDYPIAFTDSSAMPAAGAPKISEWNKIVKPDESFSMTGLAFTARTGVDAGTDTIVWVWARTAAGAGALKQAKIWRVTDTNITATLPDDIPFGLYLVWVENANGVSMPVCLNKCNTRWIGPLGNACTAGDTKRVFGENISYNRGTSTGYVFIQPASGGAMTPCTVTQVNPYAVSFTVPAGTTNGSYKVFVHNGQGGVYGWSDGLDLTVQNRWVRGSDEISLSPNGSNDTSAIQGAIDTLTARPNGGTVRLAAGTFKTYSSIRLKSNVRVVGAGMTLTTIELRLNAYAHDYIGYGGTNISVESLSLKACLDTPVPPGYNIIGGDWPVNDTFDMKFINVKIYGDFGVTLFMAGIGNYRTEVSGCEIYRVLNPGYSDAWVHDTNLYGGPYGVYQPVAPTYVGESEAAIYGGSRTVFENNHAETQDWPVNSSNGSLNYSYSADIAYKVWCKRLWLGGYFGASNNYLANNTTKDVAVQDNKGEMILLHGGGGQWFGNILSIDGCTMTARTDGTVNGNVLTVETLIGGSPVPDTNPFWVPVDSDSSVIIESGRGAGQIRRLAAHTATTFTIDKPWRIQPDTNSVLVISKIYEGHIVYNNQLNAFPVGYVQDSSASQGFDIDGNGFHNYVEGNVSRRTNAGRNMFGWALAPTYWNEIRGEQAIDCHSYGYSAAYWTTSVLGPPTLGNVYHDCSVNILASAPSGAARGYGEGLILEKITASSKMGYSLPGATAPPSYPDGNGMWPEGFVLYRNGNITATDNAQANEPTTPEPVFVNATDGKQFLIGNTYSGGVQNYYLATGLSGYSIPAPVYKVAKFQGYAGYPAQSQLVPIANAGIVPMAWTVMPSQPWITASIQANPTLAAESTLGRLAIAVDTSGMSAGRTWGYVDISNGTGTARVGVCVDLAAGSPPTQSPVASIAASPLAGTYPVTVSFDASASYDPDGSITSYAWDYGDGTYGSGVTSSHIYASANTYTPVLTVTDNAGAASKAWTNVSVFSPLSSLTISGNPNPPSDVSVPVTLNAASVGGYQVQYRFLYKDGTGWHVLRDYASGNSCLWTPSVAGYYEVKTQAKSTGSTVLFDKESSILSYPVGLIPTGMALWLKSDAGVSITGGLVSSWSDQSGSGNNVGQTSSSARPSLVDNVINGRSVVRFVGPGQVLQSTGQVLNGGTAFTAFTVGKFNAIASGAYQYFWWNGADSISGGYGCYLYSSGVMRSGWGSNSAAVTDPTPPTVGTWYRLCSRFNSSTPIHEMWTNGTQVGTRGKSGSNLSGGAFSVGNFGPSTGYGLYGDVAEIIIYGRNLTDTERANVDSYLQARWSAPAAASIDRLKDVTALGDGVLVSLSSAKAALNASGVYADGGVYVSESDRTCGLKVTGAGSVNLWDNLTLTGTTDTDLATGERVLRVTSVGSAPGSELRSLGMTNKSFTVSGRLVTVWGKVTARTTSYILVDDGSGSVVRVQTDGLSTPLAGVPNVGQYVSVTGPAGYTSGMTAVVKPRSVSDIQVY